MASKVLVIASDTLPLPGLPTSGGGLRSWQMIQGLAENGFEVVGSMPLFSHLSETYKDRIPADVRRVGWTFENQDKLVDEVQPDVVVFMNAETHALQRHRLPTIFDLAGPRLLEAQYLRVPNQAARIASKIQKLRIPDLITCAGPSQRFYFLSFLLQAGIRVEDIRIEVIPHSLSSRMPEHIDEGGAPTFVFGGGFFPWQDPRRALLALATHLDRRGIGTLHVFGESHRTSREEEDRFRDLQAALKRSPHVTFFGYVPHDELITRYCRATVAIDLMERNLEREVAFTTRTVEYLWCGLPVIYNSYSDLSRYIEKYRAGWCVDPEDEAGLQRVLDEIFDESGRVAEYGQNAQRLVREELNWATTIRPMAEFCRNPRLRLKRYYEPGLVLQTQSGTEPQDLARRLAEIEESLGWRTVVRLRAWTHTLCPPSSRRGRLVQLVLLGLRTALRIGWWETVRRALRRPGRVRAMLRTARRLTLDEQYQRWLVTHRMTSDRRRDMEREAKTWPHRPTVSLVVPMYNTPERWLRACIASVQRQVYPLWELCLADDGSTDPDVRRVLAEYESDSRIKVVHLERNLGISGASNAALVLATGEYVGLLDHDDELTEDALWEVARRLNREPGLDLIYSDEDMMRENGLREGPIFKPDWSPDLLLSFNYITHFCVIRRSVLEAVGGFRPGLDGAQDYDLVLRVTERTEAIAHIPKPLYSWRRVSGSTAKVPTAKPRAHEAGRRAVQEAVERRGQPAAHVEDGLASHYRYRVRYRIDRDATVSVLIPSWGRPHALAQCLRRLEASGAPGRLEIIIATDRQESPPDSSVPFRVVACPEPHRIGTALNAAATAARGRYLLFFNDDLSPLVPEWLDAMVEHAQRADIGAVGGKILCPDQTVESAGLVLRPDGIVGHAFRGHPARDPIYYDFPNVIRNWSVVSGNCLMLRREVFDRLGGFDEALAEHYGDVDLCLRLQAAGHRTLYTPYALLAHAGDGICWRYGTDVPRRFLDRWGSYLAAGDPYYNPNFSLEEFDHITLRP